MPTHLPRSLCRTVKRRCLHQNQNQSFIPVIFFILSQNMDTKIGALDACPPTCTDLYAAQSNGAVSTIQSSCSPTIITPLDATLGRHLARQLVQIGVTDIFSVPGDFNLTLLDHLIAEPGLTNVGCCNELNAGYAADATRGPVASALALLLSPLVGSVCSTRSLVLTVKTSLSFALLVGPSPMTMEPTGFCLTLVKSFGVFILSLAIR